MVCGVPAVGCDRFGKLLHLRVRKVGLPPRIVEVCLKTFEMTGILRLETQPTHEIQVLLIIINDG